MIQTRTLAPAARLADDGHDGLDETTFAPPPKDHQHDINRPSLLDYNVECFREILHWRDNDGKNAFDWASELGTGPDNLALEALMGAELRLAKRKQHIRNAYVCSVPPCLLSSTSLSTHTCPAWHVCVCVCVCMCVCVCVCACLVCRVLCDVGVVGVSLCVHVCVCL